MMAEGALSVPGGPLPAAQPAGSATDTPVERVVEQERAGGAASARSALLCALEIGGSGGESVPAIVVVGSGAGAPSSACCRFCSQGPPLAASKRGTGAGRGPKDLSPISQDIGNPVRQNVAGLPVRDATSWVACGRDREAQYNAARKAAKERGAVASAGGGRRDMPGNRQEEEAIVSSNPAGRPTPQPPRQGGGQGGSAPLSLQLVPSFGPLPASLPPFPPSSTVRPAGSADGSAALQVQRLRPLPPPQPRILRPLKSTAPASLDAQPALSRGLTPSAMTTAPLLDTMGELPTTTMAPDTQTSTAPSSVSALCLVFLCHVSCLPLHATAFW